MEFRLGRWHLSLTLVFILLGFLLATGFSTQQRLAERPGPRKDNLIQFIRKQRTEQKRMGGQLKDAREELAELSSEMADSEGTLATYSRQVEGLRERAGLVPVKGPGLEIVLGDAQRIPAGIDPDSFLIHDYDLQMVINALWRGGAEEIAVNGERFTAATGVRSAGSIILINSRPLGGPYKIRAIGDPDRLLKILERDPDASMLVGEYAQQFGLRAEVKKMDELTLPAYTGGISLKSGEAAG